MIKTTIKKSKIPNAGRGVFALKDIKKNEIIEKIEVIPISNKEVDSIIETSLCHYHYEYKDHYAIALGHGSLYNHNKENPNADPIDGKNCMLMKALRNIKAGEEITFDYGYEVK
jgi:hypothetical protein